MSRETFTHAEGCEVAATCVMPRRDSTCSLCGQLCSGLRAVEAQHESGRGKFAMFCRSCCEMLARVVAGEPERPAEKPARAMVLG